MEKSVNKITALLIIASVAILASALEDHHNLQQLQSSSSRIENFHSTIYIGDSNVTAGKSFWIQCITEGPTVEWFKDEEPLKRHMIRHSKDDFNYRQVDEKSSNTSRLVKSTLSVKRALGRHSGKYRCNTGKHRNFHQLHVIGDRKVELGSIDDYAENEEEEDYDEEEEEEEAVSHEDRLKSTMMMFVEEATEAVHPFSLDEVIDDGKIEDEKTTRISNKLFEFFFEPEKEEAEEDEGETEVFSTVASVTKIELNGHGNRHENLEISATVAPSFATSLIAVTEAITTTITSSSATTTMTTTMISTERTKEMQEQHQEKHHHHKSQHQHKDAAQLMPVYENGSPNKLFQITKPLVLTCNVSEGGDITKIEWFKDDKKLETVGSRHYAIKKAEGSLIIERTREEDAGEYSCQLGSEKHSFFVSAIVIVKVPENVYVVENEKLEIACIARGTEPKITWMFSNSTDVDGPFQEIQSGGRYKLDDHENIANSRLVIDHAELSDRGFYKCVGISDFMKTAGIASAESDSMVRVKDKLAALWPFLGICAEVFILCAIILIYEKRRNKTDLDESDTDQSPDQKNDYKDSDVRHRK